MFKCFLILGMCNHYCYIRFTFGKIPFYYFFYLYNQFAFKNYYIIEESSVFGLQSEITKNHWDDNGDIVFVEQDAAWPADLSGKILLLYLTYRSLVMD